jgi:hypothetical protein
VRTDQSSPSIRRRSSPSSTSPTSTGSGEIRDRSRAHAHAVSQHAAVVGQRGRARKARPHRRSVLIELAHFALIDGHLTADAASQMVVDDGAGLPVTEPPSIDRDAASAAAAPSAARGQWPPQPHGAHSQSSAKASEPWRARPVRPRRGLLPCSSSRCDCGADVGPKRIEPPAPRLSRFKSGGSRRAPPRLVTIMYTALGCAPSIRRPCLFSPRHRHNA